MVLSVPGCSCLNCACFEMFRADCCRREKEDGEAAGCCQNRAFWLSPEAVVLQCTEAGLGRDRLLQLNYSFCL